MQKTFTLFTVALIGTFSSLGQDSAQLRRIPYKLSLPVDKHSLYEEDIKATPYVLPGKTIQIYPGETIYVEVRQDSGKIISMTAVKEVKDPTRTLSIKLIQTVKKKVHEMIVLEIHNPFTSRLTYKALMFLIPQKKWVETNVYPVEPGLSGFETWPDVIVSLALGEWSFSNQ